jgi:hypothetical protein
VQLLTVVSGILSASAGLVWFLREGRSRSKFRLEKLQVEVAD